MGFSKNKFILEIYNVNKIVLDTTGWNKIEKLGQNVRELLSIRDITPIHWYILL